MKSNGRVEKCVFEQTRERKKKERKKRKKNATLSQEGKLPEQIRFRHLIYTDTMARKVHVILETSTHLLPTVTIDLFRERTPSGSPGYEGSLEF